ncbi:hypothetical protein MMC24_002565 [Lignoscripta atroalba]|nr:hypothetical protein [Lignoscripta atroalba]
MAPSRELWDSILESVRQARPEFVHAALPGVFGMQLGVEVGGKTLQHFEQIVDQADALAMERCIQIIITVDFTRELEKLAISSEVPVMILHGESDQGMPFEASTKLIEELMPRTQVKIYGKAGHGLYLTHTQQVLEDILGFLSKL